jgi:hypothetical protein
MVLTTFLFALLLSLSFFGPMVAYLIIICKIKTTKKIKKRHSTFEQEAALSGGCDVTDALPPYISRTWLPVCLLGNRNSVRKPVRFLFYVREPICSRWESFDNRGSTVVVFSRITQQKLGATVFRCVFDSNNRNVNIFFVSVLQDTYFSLRVSTPCGHHQMKHKYIISGTCFC